MATSDEEHVLGLHDEIARLTQERDAAHARGIAEGRLYVSASAAAKAACVEAEHTKQVLQMRKTIHDQRAELRGLNGRLTRDVDKARVKARAEGRAAERAELLGIATPGREGSVSGATPVEYVSGELRIPMLEASVDRLPVINVAYLADQCHAARTGLSHVTSEEANAQMDRVLRGEVRIPMLATSAEDEAVVGKLVAGVASVTNRQRMQLDKVKSAAKRITRDHRALIEDLGRNGKGRVK